MAEAQWVTIKISPKHYDATIKGLSADWGKFYTDGDKSVEKSVDDIEGTIVSAGSSYTIYACGRADSASGTEGTFEIWHDAKPDDEGDGVVIGEYYWECPWGSKTNTSTWTPKNEDYITQESGANLSGGALGNIGLRTSYVGD